MCLETEKSNGTGMKYVPLLITCDNVQSARFRGRVTHDRNGEGSAAPIRKLFAVRFLNKRFGVYA